MANLVKLALKENFNYNSKEGGGGGGGRAGAAKRGEKGKRIFSLLVPCEQALRGAVAAGREKEGELAIKSLEF